MAQSDSTRLAWGILATGRIAAAFAEGLRASQHGRLVAVGSRTRASAEAFAQTQGATRAHASYESLLADPEVEAVYIATPHPQHVEWAVRAAEAGKHILCEKPVGLNAGEAMVIGEAARRAGVVVMEAWMYRCHPLTQQVAQRIRDGVIGELRHIHASFSYHAPFDAASRTWNNALAGGAILDVGGYPLSYARLLAGAAQGVPFLNPEKLSALGTLHPETGVDVHTIAQVAFPGGITAELSTAVGLHQPQVVRAFGTKGWIEVPSPFVVARDGSPASFFVYQGSDPSPQEVVVTSDRSLYAYEADAFAEAVQRGERDVPACSWADTMGNMEALDEWRRAIGLQYEAEKPANFTSTHARRPLRRAPSATMPTAFIAGLQKPVSRLVLGVDHQRSLPHLAAVADDFFERGGTAFDTAHLYLGGLCEKLLGHWVRHRGLRDQIVLIGKGAHPPFCTPEGVTEQLHRSLERLQTDHLDVYLLHRDNPAVPVGEFVDVLAEHARAGRLRVYGASNWSVDRVAAANAYADRHGRPRLAVLSNQLSLARMVEPVWPGCRSAHDSTERQWLEENQLPLLAWSSQARGFFVDRRHRAAETAELERCWGAADNVERRARATRLAAEKGVSPTALAAAWVLQQRFPTFALIGPRSIAETVDSCAALNVTLTERERAWLDLQSDER